MEIDFSTVICFIYICIYIEDCNNYEVVTKFKTNKNKWFLSMISEISFKYNDL